MTSKHEKEAETLRGYIMDIKGRFPDYVPMRDDEVDTMLAEYVNNYPDKQKLKLMFIRKREGVYDFGSRTLNLKIMRGSIQIKIGGGYQPIDEFLLAALPVELEKLERKDPLKKVTEPAQVAAAASAQDNKSSLGKANTLARLPSKASNATVTTRKR